MARFQLTGPDGKSYEINAPDGASENDVMAYAQQQFGPQKNVEPQTDTPAAKPAATFGETAADVAKSAGSGLVKGVLAVGSTPGNLELLGRMGIDKAATALGYEDPGLSQPDKDGRRTFIPNYSDYKADLEQRVTGPLYDAKTTPGKYVQTAGELAALALGRGGAGERLTRVAVPAAASETAGQLTEGTKYEPWARAGAAIVGSMLPSVGLRTVTPNPVSPERARQVATLDAEGVTATTAGQRTGRRPLQWAESVTQDTPFAGGRAASQMELQAEQFTRAALRRAGENAPRATSDVIDQAFTRIGQQFDDLATRNTLAADARFGTDVQNVVREYNGVVNPSARAPIVQETVQDIVTALQQNNGVIAGPAYQALRSRLDRHARATRQGDPQLSDALFGLRRSLDDAMGRSIAPADQAAWTQARRQYRNMLVLEKAATSAGSNAAEGLISPSALRNATVAQNRRDYARGRGDFADLARAGEAVMKPLPQSGTAPRAAASGALQVLGGFAGHSAAGMPGAAAGVLTPAIAARTLMSSPVQRWLSNQVAAPIQQNRLLRADLEQFIPPMGGVIIEDQ